MGPAHGVGDADGRFAVYPEPVHIIAGLLSVHAFLKNGRALAYFEDIRHRIRGQQILVAFHRVAGDIGNDLDDGLDLGALLQWCAVKGIAPSADVVCLLLAAHRFGGSGFGSHRGCRQVFLQAITLDIGPFGVSDDFDVVPVAVTDKAVQPIDQVAARLVEGSFGRVLEQRIQALGRNEGELILSDGRDRDATAGNRLQEIPGDTCWTFPGP